MGCKFLIQGYVFYFPPQPDDVINEGNISLPTKLTVSPSELHIENKKSSIDTLTIKLNCDFDEKLPCSIHEYIYNFGQENQPYEKKSNIFT